MLFNEGADYVFPITVIAKSLTLAVRAREKRGACNEHIKTYNIYKKNQKAFRRATALMVLFFLKIILTYYYA